jgi:hypothetical protein
MKQLLGIIFLGSRAAPVRPLLAGPSFQLPILSYLPGIDRGRQSSSDPTSGPVNAPLFIQTPSGASYDPRGRFALEKEAGR